MLQSQSLIKFVAVKMHINYYAKYCQKANANNTGVRQNKVVLSAHGNIHTYIHKFFPFAKKCEISNIM